MMGLGELFQAQDQAETNGDIDRYNYESNADRQLIEWLNAIATGQGQLGGSSVGTSQQPVQRGSPLAGVGSALSGVAGLASIFGLSDPRTKKDVVYLGDDARGVGWYEFGFMATRQTPRARSALWPTNSSGSRRNSSPRTRRPALRSSTMTASRVGGSRHERRVFQMLAGYGAGGANDDTLAALFGGAVNPYSPRKPSASPRGRVIAGRPWTYHGSTEIPTGRGPGGGARGGGVPGGIGGGVFGLLGVPGLTGNQTPRVPTVPGGSRFELGFRPVASHGASVPVQSRPVRGPVRAGWRVCVRSPGPHPDERPPAQCQTPSRCKRPRQCPSRRRRSHPRLPASASAPTPINRSATRFAPDAPIGAANFEPDPFSARPPAAAPKRDEARQSGAVTSQQGGEARRVPRKPRKPANLAGVRIAVGGRLVLAVGEPRRRGERSLGTGPGSGEMIADALSGRSTARASAGSRTKPIASAAAASASNPATSARTSNLAS